MSPTSFTSSSPRSGGKLVAWTEEERRRLWELRESNSYLSWPDFYALNLFPHRTQTAVYAEYRRMKEKQQTGNEPLAGIGNPSNSAHLQLSRQPLAPPGASGRRPRQHLRADDEDDEESNGEDGSIHYNGQTEPLQAYSLRSQNASSSPNKRQRLTSLPSPTKSMQSPASLPGRQMVSANPAPDGPAAVSPKQKSGAPPDIRSHSRPQKPVAARENSGKPIRATVGEMQQAHLAGTHNKLATTPATENAQMTEFLEIEQDSVVSEQASAGGPTSLPGPSKTPAVSGESQISNADNTTAAPSSPEAAHPSIRSTSLPTIRPTMSASKPARPMGANGAISGGTEIKSHVSTDGLTSEQRVANILRLLAQHMGSLAQERRSRAETEVGVVTRERDLQQRIEQLEASQSELKEEIMVKNEDLESLRGQLAALEKQDQRITELERWKQHVIGPPPA